MGCDHVDAEALRTMELKLVAEIRPFEARRGELMEILFQNKATNANYEEARAV